MLCYKKKYYESAASNQCCQWNVIQNMLKGQKLKPDGEIVSLRSFGAK